MENQEQQRRRETHAPERNPNPCPLYRKCGGCQLQNMSYQRQLHWKQELVERLLGRFHRVNPIIGMEHPYHYRNKVQAAFALDRRKQIVSGVYQASTHRVVPVESCMIEDETADRIVGTIRKLMKDFKMEPYNEDTGAGFVRHAVVRVGHKSGEVLVTVVTNGEEFPASKAFCRELARRVPEVTTIVQNVNTRQTNVILGDKERVLFGPGFILDTLCGLTFRISSQSFYQVNATQTEVLYDEAIRLANLTGVETVIDAYCGTGTIGLVAASRGAARVIGVDSVEAAIRDAANNARHNGVENAEFVAQDATAFMKELAASEERPQPLVLLMDPPRAGSTPEFLAGAAALAPERIVYISCNPATQARDVRQLVKSGYEMRAIRSVDMFPHTDHVESIVMLEREDRRGGARGGAHRARTV